MVGSLVIFLYLSDFVYYIFDIEKLCVVFDFFVMFYIFLQVEGIYEGVISGYFVISIIIMNFSIIICCNGFDSICCCFGRFYLRFMFQFVNLFVLYKFGMQRIDFIVFCIVLFM